MKTQSGGLLRWDIKSEKIDGGGGGGVRKRKEERRGVCVRERLTCVRNLYFSPPLHIYIYIYMLSHSHSLLSGTGGGGEIVKVVNN